MKDSASANFSVENFLADHSMEDFCEEAWKLSDHMVNKRMKEPEMFKVRTREYQHVPTCRSKCLNLHVHVYIPVHSGGSVFFWIQISYFSKQ